MRQGTGAAGKATKNVGVEETDPRCPHIGITGKIQKLEQEIDKIVIWKIRYQI